MRASKYPDESSQSARLYERALNVLPGGNSRATVALSPYPIYAKSGAGCRLIDEDGVERIDFYNNATSLIHGHAHPDIVQAVSKQVALGSAFAHPTVAEIELAELLCERVPGFDRVRFCNSGTEAVMNAVKAARAFTGRHRIAKCEGVYHGSYDPVEVSLHPAPHQWGDPHPVAVAYAEGTPPSVLGDVTVIPFNETESAEAILTRQADSLAAIVIDLLPSRLGMVPASAEFLAMLRSLCDAHGIVLIFDEVISFRIGPRGMQGALGVPPDLTALGKIIGGGFPVGAVAGRADMMSVFDDRSGRAALPHAGTFNGNPVTMTAGKAAMELMTPQAFDNLNAMGQAARGLLADALRETGVPGAVAGYGSLFLLRLTDAPAGYRGLYPTPDLLAKKLAMVHHALSNGIIFNTALMGALSTPMDQAELVELAAVVRSGLEMIASLPAPVP